MKSSSGPCDCKGIGSLSVRYPLRNVHSLPQMITLLGDVFLPVGPSQKRMLCDMSLHRIVEDVAQ